MVICGNCGLRFSRPAPEGGTGELVGRDTDFCPRYRGHNPLFYRVYVCTSCHFAAYKEDFSQIEESSRERVREALASIGPGMAADFSQPERSLFVALRAYQLAMICYAARRFPSEVLGGCAIRAGWLCRYAGELWREQDYMEQALAHYKDAFERGARYDTHLDDLAIAYLVGELLCRTGEAGEARGYFELVRKAPDTKPYLRDLAEQRHWHCHERELVLGALREVHAFKPLNSRSLALLAAYSDLSRLPGGALVYRRGDGGQSMFVVVSGAVEVHLGDPRAASAVATLRRPDTFGELSLFSGAPRGATVVVAGDSRADSAELVEISLTAFRYLVKSEPRVAEQVALDVAKRQSRYAQLALDLLAEEQARRKPSAMALLAQRIRDLIAIPDTALGPSK